MKSLEFVGYMGTGWMARDIAGSIEHTIALLIFIFVGCSLLDWAFSSARRWWRQ